MVTIHLNGKLNYFFYKRLKVIFYFSDSFKLVENNHNLKHGIIIIAIICWSKSLYSVEEGDFCGGTKQVSDIQCLLKRVTLWYNTLTESTAPTPKAT